jgi:hypothetical protein
MAQELFVSLPHLSKFKALPQLEWVSSPQPNIPNYAYHHLFNNADGDDFKDATNLINLCLDGLILLDCDKMLEIYLEENELFQNKTGTCSKNVAG